MAAVSAPLTPISRERCPWVSRRTLSPPMRRMLSNRRCCARPDRPAFGCRPEGLHYVGLHYSGLHLISVVTRRSSAGLQACLITCLAEPPEQPHLLDVDPPGAAA